MSLYHIITPKQQFSIREHSSVVTEASLEIDWAVALPFAYVRDYCKRKGWTVVPALASKEQNTITFQGIRYELFWRHGNLASIERTNLETGAQDEITWQELPDVLKGVL